jgi:hypothetical protein
MTFPALNRRRFLRGAGVALALPFLEAFAPVRAAEKAAPRRLVCINTNLGILKDNFFPKGAGRDYVPSPYLEPLKEYRDQLSVFSGLSHPDAERGHQTEFSYLTGARYPASPGFKNTISLDQYVLEKLPPETRSPCLVLATDGNLSGISYTRSGVRIPSEPRPSVVFRKLFVKGTPAEEAEQTQRLQDGRSILDRVLEDAHDMQRTLGPRDQQRLDDFLGSVREVEKRLTIAQEWQGKARPTVPGRPPTDVNDRLDIVARTRLMFDVIHLALQTDSTRVVTFSIGGFNAVPKVAGVNQDWHNLSHNGKDPEKLDQLKLIELEEMKLLGAFLGKLKGSGETGDTLLDRTMVMYGSNLGNASSHDGRNLPILLAGGGFKHGQHLAFDEENNTPLCQLFVSMLQRLGVETDHFASGNKRLPGLDLA